ncbi:Uncharacterised protein [Burkholderia pseudomallei]|uniref:DUF7249 family protein n=1 Tax=Burkholderia pseudomallei TaxID=28450 RepID=UPI0005E5A753|nr:hypothetical protein [Burkholderia pseudomallei]CFK64672.1 Uncharacterised protein [Burkholderia pseudomallei]CPF87323.1 Uncharacterised protein [Burkholderia pseudomallei]CPG41989.1 Uncharacterised protein [Burkholderia pseudomallei]
MSKYLGWKNYETWNVAMWICNEPFFYATAKEFKRMGMGYRAFAKLLHLLDVNTTPDGISLQSTKLSIRELNRLIKDL